MWFRSGESIFVVADGSLRAVFGVTDPLRASAESVVGQLVAAGWRVELLSGDHQQTSRAVGRQLGIAEEHAHGGLLPEEKLAAIKATLADVPSSWWATV